MASLSWNNSVKIFQSKPSSGDLQLSPLSAHFSFSPVAISICQLLLTHPSLVVFCLSHMSPRVSLCIWSEVARDAQPETFRCDTYLGSPLKTLLQSLSFLSSPQSQHPQVNIKPPVPRSFHLHSTQQPHCAFAGHWGIHSKSPVLSSPRGIMLKV